MPSTEERIRECGCPRSNGVLGMTLPLDEELLALRNTRVRIQLDENVFVEGVLCSWTEDGEVNYRDEAGTMWNAWPLLAIEAAI